MRLHVIKKRYVLFSINGFTEGLKDAAVDEVIALVELKDLMAMRSQLNIGPSGLRSISSTKADANRG